jgi:hypothetical protein
MSDQRIEKHVTDYMISENESSPNAIKAAENIMECNKFLSTYTPKQVALITRFSYYNSD